MVAISMEKGHHYQLSKLSLSQLLSLCAREIVKDAAQIPIELFVLWQPQLLQENFLLLALLRAFYSSATRPE